MGTLGCAGVRLGTPRCAGVRLGTPRYARVRPGTPRYARVRSGTRGYARVHRVRPGTPGYAWVRPSTPGAPDNSTCEIRLHLIPEDHMIRGCFLIDSCKISCMGVGPPPLVQDDFVLHEAPVQPPPLVCKCKIQISRLLISLQTQDSFPRP